MLKHLSQPRRWLAIGHPISTPLDDFPSLCNVSDQDPTFVSDDGTLPDLSDGSTAYITSNSNSSDTGDSEMTGWHLLVSHTTKSEQLQYLLYTLIDLRFHPIFKTLYLLSQFSAPEKPMISYLQYGLDDDYSFGNTTTHTSKWNNYSSSNAFTWDGVVLQRNYLALDHPVLTASGKQLQLFGVEASMSLDEYLMQVQSGDVDLDLGHLKEISASALFNLNYLLFKYDSNYSNSNNKQTFSIISSDCKVYKASNDFKFPNAFSNLLAACRETSELMQMMPAVLLSELFHGCNGNDIPLLEWKFGVVEVEEFYEKWRLFKSNVFNRMNNYRQKIENRRKESLVRLL